jgi:F-type H+-transporting ATPase subunit alpha
MRKVTGTLRLELAQYRELEVFSQFGSELDAATLEFLAQGQRITEVLKQDQYRPMDVVHQVIMLYVVSKKMLLDIELSDIKTFKRQFIEYVDNHYRDLIDRIRQTQDLTEEDEKVIQEAVREFKRMFKKAAAPKPANGANTTHPRDTEPAQAGEPPENGSAQAVPEAAGDNDGADRA